MLLEFGRFSICFVTKDAALWHDTHGGWIGWLWSLYDVPIAMYPPTVSYDMMIGCVMPDYVEVYIVS